MAVTSGFPRGRQRGSAVPFAVACLGLLLAVGAGLGVVGALVAGHRSAQAAADLAALAGAGASSRGEDGCAAAAATALRNGAALVACELHGDGVRVLVGVEGPWWSGWHGDLQAEARGGPVT